MMWKSAHLTSNVSLTLHFPPLLLQLSITLCSLKGLSCYQYTFPSHSWNSWDGGDQVACALGESALYETYYAVCSDHLSSVLRDRWTDRQTKRPVKPAC